MGIIPEAIAIDDRTLTEDAVLNNKNSPGLKIHANCFHTDWIMPGFLQVCQVLVVTCRPNIFPIFADFRHLFSIFYLEYF
jgi:hypothetical protein